MIVPDSLNPRDLACYKAMAQVMAAAEKNGYPCRVQVTLSDGTQVTHTNDQARKEGDWKKLVSIPYEMLSGEMLDD